MNKLIGYRKVLACSMSALALAGPLSVYARTAPANTAGRVFTINLPASQMSNSLSELGRRTGLNILYTPEAVQGLRAPGVSGVFMPEQALRMILHGAPLEVLKQPNGAIIIRRRDDANMTTVAATSYSPRRNPARQLAALDTQRTPDVAPAAAENDGGLEEIVVTAKRRSENQQDVPIAISTVTGDALGKMGIGTTESLGVAVPALQFGRQGGNGGTPFLRGVGTPTAAAAVESPVAVYVDDVYIGAPSGTLLKLAGVESVAVLKGPQGTLFGRNATGGVIQVQTKNPSHNTALDVTAGYGNYDTFSGSLYTTTGLTDTLAVNFTASGEHQGKGYGHSIATGKDVWKSWDYAFRGKLLWQPSSDTSFLLSGDYSRRNSDMGMNSVPFPGTVALGGATFPGRYLTYAAPGDYAKNKTYGTSAKLQHDFGGVNLVSISAYRRVEQQVLIDVDGSLPGAPIITQAIVTTGVRTFSQELQLLSPSTSKLKWIVGAFYYYQNADLKPSRTTGTSLAPFGGVLEVYATSKLNSYSGFGELTYELLPNLEVTAGLRYTADQFDYTGIRYNAAGAALAPGRVNAGDDFSKLTYRGIVSYKPNNNAMLYASYSRGFRSGGYTISQPSRVVNGVAVANVPVLPETLDAYEVGLKSELFDRKFRFNVAAFHYNYSNMQVPIIVTGNLVNLNAAKSRMNGLDVDLAYAPTKGLTFTAGAAFLDSKFLSFPNGPLNVPNPASCTPVPRTTGPLTGGNTGCPSDLSGNRTTRSPKFVGALGIMYRIPTDVGTFALDATLNHNSGYFWEPDNRTRQPAYDILNAGVTWFSQDGKFELKIYGRNLLDEYYYAQATETNSYDGFTPAMPLSYGFSVTVHL